AGNDWTAEPLPSDGDIKQFCAVGESDLWAIVSTPSGFLCIERYSGGEWQKAADAPTATVSQLPLISAGKDGAVWCGAYFNVVWVVQNAASGWERCITPTAMHGFTAPGGVTEIVAVEDRQQVWHALYVQEGQINYTWFDGGTWNDPVTVAAGNKIGLTRHQQ